MLPAKVASLIIVVMVFGLIIAAYMTSEKFGLSEFTSDIDGKSYSVRTDSSESNMQTAANYLADLSGRVDRLVDHMHSNSIPDQETASRLKDRWSRCSLRETGPRSPVTAVTVDKDREIQLCIRDPNGDFENINTSMFVLLHELAHVMSVSYDHEPEFYDNFAHVAKAAAKIGVYKPDDFTKTPGSYCGTAITKTPCSNGACPVN